MHGEFFTAGAADGHRFREVVVVPMLDQHRRAGLARQVTVAPRGQRVQDGYQFLADVREGVLVTLRAALVKAALNNPALDKCLETVGQDVAGDLEAPLQLVELARPEHPEVPQDQKAPTLAHNFERTSERANKVKTTVRHVG